FLSFVGLGFLARPWFASVDQIFPFFTTPFLAMLIAINWTWFGMYVILFSAGMREIPQKYLDAAKIDGLSEFTKLRKIIFPSLKPLWFSFSILAVSGSFKSFAFIWSTTMGGPGHSTEVAGTFLYRKAFRYLDMGYASTVGIVVALLGFILMVLALKRAGKLF
ncbi:MAG: carbohydrate ABC transporter permease, partial [Candidatus Bipolaricaulia bacterium]